MSSEVSNGKARILVTGGWGYIGSHVVLALVEAGHEVTIIDNHTTSRGSNMAGADLPAELYSIDVRDVSAMEMVAEIVKPQVVIHLAALSCVGESFERAAEYMEVNVRGTEVVIETMRKYCRNFIFSSTAAVYAPPDEKLTSENWHLTERSEINPLSPYGQSKIMAEDLFEILADEYRLNVNVFRFFNACGAHPSGEYGEQHDPETHLIPLLVQAAHEGQAARVNGKEFNTPDGTCVRDYIHVCDIAKACVIASEDLLDGRSRGCQVKNLGTGEGTSVLEVINEVSRQMGELAYEVVGAREGDAHALVTRSVSNLIPSWKPTLSDISTIITHVRRFEEHQRKKRAPERLPL